MAHLVLVACGAKKASSRVRARELYQGALFKKSLAYADRIQPDAIYILSAKHGLLPADQPVDPYDESLNEKSTAEIRVWADAVLRDLGRVADLEKDRFTILAGDKYRRYLMGALPCAEVPLEGLGIGRQLQRLDLLCRQLGSPGDHRVPIRVLASVVERNGRLLLCKRPSHKRHGNLWEFPGGKVEAGETDFAAVRRELEEELGVTTTKVGDVNFSVADPGSEFVIEFLPVEIEGVPECREHAELAWVEPEAILGYQLAPSDRRYASARWAMPTLSAGR